MTKQFINKIREKLLADGFEELPSQISSAKIIFRIKGRYSWYCFNRLHTISFTGWKFAKSTFTDEVFIYNNTYNPRSLIDFWFPPFNQSKRHRNWKLKRGKYSKKGVIHATSYK